jgi:hypothetical protein
MTQETPDELFKDLSHFIQSDPESKRPWVKEHFMDAVAGDVEAAADLAYSLKYTRADLVTWFKIKFDLGDISQPVFGAVLRTTYQMGNIFGGFRNLNIPTSEVVQMFQVAGPHVMTPEDLMTFHDLPEEIPVFRGCIGSARAAQHSLSWTTQRYVGEKFADLHTTYDHQEGVVYSGIARRTDVLAYFSNRDEFEIVCRPFGVKSLTQLPVRPTEEREGPTWAEQMRKFQADVHAGIENKLAARKIAA